MLGAVVMLVLVSASMVSTMRSLRETVDALRSETIATVTELRRTVELATGELERVDHILDSAERITGTVDSTSRLTHRALAPPLIKSVSFFAGSARALRRLRGRSSAPAIDVTSSDGRSAERKDRA